MLKRIGSLVYIGYRRCASANTTPITKEISIKKLIFYNYEFSNTAIVFSRSDLNAACLLWIWLARSGDSFTTSWL